MCHKMWHGSKSDMESDLKRVILQQRHFCQLGDIGKHLKTLSVVVALEKLLQVSAGRDQGRCSVPQNAQNRLQHKLLCTSTCSQLRSRNCLSGAQSLVPKETEFFEKKN